MWPATALTGGSSGSLDAIVSSKLTNGDMAIAIVSSVVYFYSYDSSSTDAEDSPDVIQPDDLPTSGRWILSEIRGNIQGVAGDDPYVGLLEIDGTSWYWGIDDSNDEVEFRTSETVDNNVKMTLGDDGTMGVINDLILDSLVGSTRDSPILKLTSASTNFTIQQLYVYGVTEIINDTSVLYIKLSGDTDDYLVFGVTSDVPYIGTMGSCDLKLSSDSGDIQFSDDNLITTGRGEFKMISGGTQTVTYTASGDIPTLVATVVLLDGDNDSANETLDLQDGVNDGQRLIIKAHADIDADDNVTVAMTDTTCTNCPTIMFDKVGENATLVWDGSGWFVVSLQDSL